LAIGGHEVAHLLWADDRGVSLPCGLSGDGVSPETWIVGRRRIHAVAVAVGPRGKIVRGRVGPEARARARDGSAGGRLWDIDLLLKLSCVGKRGVNAMLGGAYRVTA